MKISAGKPLPPWTPLPHLTTKTNQHHKHTWNLINFLTDPHLTNHERESILADLERLENKYRAWEPNDKYR